MHSLWTWLTALCRCVTVFVRAVLTAVGISPFHVSTHVSFEDNSNRRHALDMPLQLKLASASCMWPAVTPGHSWSLTPGLRIPELPAVMD